MPDYRVFFKDPDGRINRAPEIIECADDLEAAEKAQQFIDGHDIEIWEMARLIAKFPRK